MIGRIISAAFQLQIMALAINVMNGHGPTNKMRCQLQANNSKLMSCILPTVNYTSVLNVDMP